ncbi:hypothetical protein EDB92DRAFT_2105594 [Lactarius akahatsu]|uniref:Uncharacterized protein n=1 Tax=Lactarius akahatsu TaxID=416441 RepID=A0AAD4LAE0_9AGAM|nr:hypothetical protein EDB92DRAFT_2105594 [Lactarius akahatsu]
MTDWKSPAVITAEYCPSLGPPTFLTIYICITVALIKLCHTISGILIWEFVMNIGFEYSVFTGKRKFRSSFLLYLGARWYPLFCVITILVGFDSTNRINCQAYAIFVFVRLCGISSITCKIAISIASAAWLANTGSLIHSIAIVRATWSEGFCKITNISETRSNIPVTFVTDSVLLALMFTGLLRLENAHQRGGVWWLLYTQGLAWMIIVVVAQAPITVFILLDLNDPMDVMFQAPTLITMTIGASRVYRGLSDYVHKEANVHMSEGLPVRQSPIIYSVPLSDRCSLAMGISGIPDGHIFGTDPLPPPKHHFRPGDSNGMW